MWGQNKSSRTEILNTQVDLILKWNGHKIHIIYLVVRTLINLKNNLNI